MVPIYSGVDAERQLCPALRPLASHRTLKRVCMTVSKFVAKVWLDGNLVGLAKPARLEVERQWRVTAELDDGVIVRGGCRLA